MKRERIKVSALVGPTETAELSVIVCIVCTQHRGIINYFLEESARNRLFGEGIRLRASQAKVTAVAISEFEAVTHLESEFLLNDYRNSPNMESSAGNSNCTKIECCACN